MIRPLASYNSSYTTPSLINVGYSLRACLILLISLFALSACTSTADKSSINKSIASKSTTNKSTVSKHAPFGPHDFSDTQKWTAIVAAFEPEIAAIESAFDASPHAFISNTINIKGVEYQLGTYKSEPVVIFTTGISVTNAAMTMQMALDYFPIDTVVMMGIAGSVNPVYAPGDISVPERWYYHDESLYANPKPDSSGDYFLLDFHQAQMAEQKKRASNDSHAPAYTNFDYVFPREVSVVKAGINEAQKMPYFSVTPSLLNLASVAHKKLGNVTMPSGKPIQIRIGGNGVTGSVFVDNAEYRVWLEEVYQAEVAEMESAAVGQVCFVNDVDWIVIRSVSDLAGGQHVNSDSGKQGTENVFDAILAAGTGTTFMMALLDEIAKNKSLN